MRRQMKTALDIQQPLEMNNSSFSELVYRMTEVRQIRAAVPILSRETYHGLPGHLVHGSAVRDEDADCDFEPGEELVLGYIGGDAVKKVVYLLAGDHVERDGEVPDKR